MACAGRLGLYVPLPVAVAVPTVVPPLVQVVGALACGPKTAYVIVPPAPLAPPASVALIEPAEITSGGSGARTAGRGGRRVHRPGPPDLQGDRAPVLVAAQGEGLVLISRDGGVHAGASCALLRVEGIRHGRTGGRGAGAHPLFSGQEDQPGIDRAGGAGQVGCGGRVVGAAGQLLRFPTTIGLVALAPPTATRSTIEDLRAAGQRVGEVNRERACTAGIAGRW